MNGFELARGSCTTRKGKSKSITIHRFPRAAATERTSKHGSGCRPKKDGELLDHGDIGERGRNLQLRISVSIIGKAVPPGARKGGFGLGADPGNALLKRLKEHAKSIKEAKNLDIEDFSCRYLVCEDIWIPLGEALLIERFQPPWNILIEGFGIHTPGKGRKKQVRSKWDTLHPGRNLADGLPQNPVSKERVIKLIADFFAGKKAPVLTAAEAVVEEEEKEEEDE